MNEDAKTLVFCAWVELELISMELDELEVLLAAVDIIVLLDDTTPDHVWRDHYRSWNIWTGDHGW